MYSKVRKVLKDSHQISSDSKFNAFYLSPKEDYDIFVDFEVTDPSELFNRVSTLVKGGRTMTKISLERQAVMTKVLLNDIKVQFEILLQKIIQAFHGADSITASSGVLTALVTMCTNSSKDYFHNFSTWILLSTVNQLLTRNLHVIALCPSDFQIDEVLAEVQFQTAFTSVTCIAHTDGNKELEDVQLYISTKARVHKCAVEHAIKVACGEFSFKNSDGSSSILKNYICQRSGELLKQAEERLFDCNQHLTIELVCQRMLPFIVLYDLFSSTTPFNPTRLSPEQLRDAVFIHYNIARIAHIKEVYDKLEKSSTKVDISSLDLEVEWLLVCQLVNFEKIFEEAFISPINNSINDGVQVNLKIHKLLQFLVKLVKLFSKYYSCTKIVTYDHKETLIVRMNTRMLLVNAVYNVLVFSLKDVFGVPLVLNI